MKQFYIIMSTISAFMARDFIYSGEFPHSDFGKWPGAAKADPSPRWRRENKGTALIS
jgi:hypothetical protein